MNDCCCNKTEVPTECPKPDGSTGCGYSVGDKLSLSDVVLFCFITQFFDNKEAAYNATLATPRLRKIVDFADIYSLIAPRPLLCQNGLKEPLSQFPVHLAREVKKEVEIIARAL